MLTRSFVVIVGVIVVILAVGGSWTVDALSASHATPIATATPIAGATGKQGSAGKDGDNGSDGTNGAAGSNGDNGAAGATGKAGTSGKNGANGINGTNGTNGLAGPPGADGASGTSAPTFSAIIPAGLSPADPGGEIDFPGSITAVPAGPALVGFSIELNATIGIQVSCSIVDAADSSIVYGSTALINPGVGTSFATYEVTQVVNLPAATSLGVVCNQMAVFPVVYTFQNLSIYAISFA
ncbi:MAG TPA: hypothetical protein VHZ81_15875 [Galbitalea sp.]|nr:hypothetical protein [Galbitalea sp.]